MANGRLILFLLLLSPVLATGAGAEDLRDRRQVDIAPAIEASRQAFLTLDPFPERRAAPRPGAEWSTATSAPPAPITGRERDTRLSIGGVDDGTPVLLRPDGESAVGGMIQLHRTLP